MNCVSSRNGSNWTPPPLLVGINLQGQVSSFKAKSAFPTATFSVSKTWHSPSTIQLKAMLHLCHFWDSKKPDLLLVSLANDKKQLPDFFLTVTPCKALDRTAIYSWPNPQDSSLQWEKRAACFKKPLCTSSKAKFSHTKCSSSIYIFHQSHLKWHSKVYRNRHVLFIHTKLI